MVQLHAQFVSKLAPGQSLETIARLDASNKEITEIGDLAACSKLSRLDVSKNNLKSLDGVASVPSLRWLSAAGNRLASASAVGAALRELAALEVLNLGRNQLEGKLAVGRLQALKALILNDNRLTLVGGLEKARELNTLVLSHNALAGLGTWCAGCAKLEKLSLSHNQLRELGDALKGCPLLTELRLNHNQLTALPADLAANRRLRILDLGGNPIASWEGVQVLGELPQLRSLSLKGTPLAALPEYRERIAALVPRLEILDNQRISERPRRRQPTADGGPAAPEPAGGKPEAEQTASPANAAPGPAAAASKDVKRRQNTAELPAKPAEAAMAAGKEGKQSKADKHRKHRQQTAAPAPQSQEQEQHQRQRKVRQEAQQQEGSRTGPKPGGTTGAPPVVPPLQQAAKHVEAQIASGDDAAEGPDQRNEAGPPKKKRRRRSKRPGGGAAEELEEEGPTLGQAAERAASQGQQKPLAQLVMPGTWQEQPFDAAMPSPAVCSDTDDDAADAAQLLGQPAKKKRDPKQTGVLKVIDATRRKKKGKQQGGVTGAQALQALLHPAAADAGFGAGLPAWD